MTRASESRFPVRLVDDSASRGAKRQPNSRKTKDEVMKIYEKDCLQSESFTLIPRSTYAGLDEDDQRLCCFVPDAIPVPLRTQLTKVLQTFLAEYPPSKLKKKDDNRHITFKGQRKCHGIYHLGAWQAFQKNPCVSVESGATTAIQQAVHRFISSTPMQGLSLS
ncbi:hypothetical protein DFJ77DRAFT_473612 [Powellomyces hirtus]|nr:hypothetical protein DFJ77DRAFT_473612 [Powellomyces hirtus]